jgi:hypothetical protein
MVFGEDDGNDCENARIVRLRSRRKAGELTSEKRRHKKSTKSPLEFTYKKLSLYFMLPLPIAARALEISHTSLKKLCRELGIARWPYVRGRLERFGRLGAAQEGNAPETLGTSIPNAGTAKSAESEVWNLARIAFSNFDSTTASAASTPASTPSRTSTALAVLQARFLRSRGWSGMDQRKFFSRQFVCSLTKLLFWKSPMLQLC